MQGCLKQKQNKKSKSSLIRFKILACLVKKKELETKTKKMISQCVKIYFKLQKLEKKN